jgi:hypothetical protein
MAIDQRDVSSTLRFMDDRALQQYAAMHKNDPYIFPLAFQESQNRQRLRMSQQTAQGMQPQPKVADQALAQMAPQPMPEEQGIGALPVGNMETMADGGIAGYPDDDFVTRNQSVVMMAGGGHVPRYQGNPRDGSLVRLPYGGNTMGMPDPTQEALSALQAEEAGAATARTRKIAELEQQVAFLTAAGAPQAATVKAQLDALKGPTTTSPTDPNFRRQEDPRMKPGVAATAQPLLTSDAAPKVDTGRRNKPAPAPETVSADKEPTGIDALVNKFTRATDLAQGALKNQRVGIGAELVKSAEEDKAEGEKRRKEEGDVFAGKEARLAEREKGVEGMGDKYMGLALLQAGAAMMSTPGSIGMALGKGIQVGSERYIAGIDKINAAKDKFAEARDRLDDLRLNRADMTKKEIRDEDRAIRNARLKGQELLLDGATNDLKISNDNQKAIFGVAAENIQTDKKITSAEKIARLQASSGNRNNQLELLQALQADPKLMAAYRTMQGKNEDVMGQYNDYLKANPALALDPKAAFTQFLMTKSAFAQLGAPTVTDKAAGPVRKQP